MELLMLQVEPYETKKKKKNLSGGEDKGKRSFSTMADGSVNSHHLFRGLWGKFKPLRNFTAKNFNKQILA
jgi:hypothetical protein